MAWESGLSPLDCCIPSSLAWTPSRTKTLASPLSSAPKMSVYITSPIAQILDGSVMLNRFLKENMFKWWGWFQRLPENVKCILVYVSVGFSYVCHASLEIFFIYFSKHAGHWRVFSIRAYKICGTPILTRCYWSGVNLWLRTPGLLTSIFKRFSLQDLILSRKALMLLTFSEPT